jgi:hypothetical protein
MKLQNAQKSVVDAGKITEYLLNPEHPDNGGKARFFTMLGFSRDEPGDLVAALEKLAGAGSVVNRVDTIHGVKYIVDGRIVSPTGRSAPVRTVWIVDRGSDSPRLVTAYPVER